MVKVKYTLMLLLLHNMDVTLNHNHCVTHWNSSFLCLKWHLYDWYLLQMRLGDWTSWPQRCWKDNSNKLPNWLIIHFCWRYLHTRLLNAYPCYGNKADDWYLPTEECVALWSYCWTTSSGNSRLAYLSLVSDSYIVMTPKTIYSTVIIVL